MSRHLNKTQFRQITKVILQQTKSKRNPKTIFFNDPIFQEKKLNVKKEKRNKVNKA